VFGDDLFRVNVGEENTYTFTVNDTNNFTVVVGGATQDGALSEDGDGVYTFRWTPRSFPTRDLTFIATDDLDASSVHSPLLQVCACFNGGECTPEGVSPTNRRIQNLTCLCTEGKRHMSSLRVNSRAIAIPSLHW
jgi:hypothetical protein